MLLAPAILPRKYPLLPAAVDRLFEVEPGSQILGKCHWQKDPAAAPTLISVHGLEGSTESSYMLGLAERAHAAGFNAIRLNQRNCGGTENLTPTLYNSGLSGDFRAVMDELIARDSLPEIFFAGFSMGGNLVLKMAGELGDRAPAQLKAVCAVNGSLDLAPCVDAIEKRRNAFYHWHFVRRLKRRMRDKIELYPDLYNADGLEAVRTLREFDDKFTAPHSGYAGAADYYYRASALRVVAEIRVPTLLIYAEDDPLIPTSIYDHAEVVNNPNIERLAAAHGSHCSYVSDDPAERFWAEARVVEFCAARSAIL